MLLNVYWTLELKADKGVSDDPDSITVKDTSSTQDYNFKQTIA